MKNWKKTKKLFQQSLKCLHLCPTHDETVWSRRSLGLTWIQSQINWGNLQCERCCFHFPASRWKRIGSNQKPEGWLSRFQDSKWKVLDPHYLRCSPSKKPNFHFKKADWSPTLALIPFLLPSLLLCPLSCCLSLEEGRLHKSVTQEIPTLYFLSDKKPVMGDEFVAAGGFDRLRGNNKAISACQESRRTERGKHIRGRYKSLVWWLQFFFFFLMAKWDS